MYLFNLDFLGERGFKILFDFDYDHNLLLIRTEFCCRYFSKLFEITSCYLPNVHVYADDTQLYISFSPNDIDEQMNTLFAIEDCVAAIRSWMFENKLKFNDDKTEFLLVGTKQQLAKVCIKVGCVEISSSSVRNFGVWFDSSLNMSEHITKLCASAFFCIYSFRRIRKYLSRDSAETLVHAFISSRLDTISRTTGNVIFGVRDLKFLKLQPKSGVILI